MSLLARLRNWRVLVLERHFKIVGFTEEPTLESLAQLADEAGVLLIDDQGSGCLMDLRTIGLPPQPLLQESAAAADVTTIASRSPARRRSNMRPALNCRPSAARC